MCGSKSFAQVSKYQKAAEQGNAEAQYSVGTFYKYGGGGVKKDLTKAAYWYRKAAEQGNFGGQYRLGECYQFGKGVKKDSAKAVYWYRKAAAQGLYVAEKKLEQFKDMPIVIDFAIDEVFVESVKDGVKDEYKITDVDVLRIYRYGKIEYGNKQKMFKLTTFTRADVNEFSDNSVELGKDWGFETVMLYADVDYRISMDMIQYLYSKGPNDEKTITFFCNAKENIKLKKILELVKQNKFISEEW